MKKQLKVFLALVLVLMVSGMVTAFADNDITVTIEGEPVIFDGQGAESVDGRTLVPVRGVFEMLGFDVDWDRATSTAIITNADYEMRITIGSATFTTNGISHTLDVPAQNIGGRTLVPIRLPLESVGFYLEWDGGTRTVLISAEPIPEQAPTPASAPPATPVATDNRVISFDGINVTNELLANIIATGELPAGTSFFYVYDSRESVLEPFDLPNGLIGFSGGLRLAGYQISDLTSLSELTNLTGLSLFGGQISDLTPLGELTNLTKLWISATQISDLTPLSGLTNLRDLNLSRNQISDITPLSGLTNLTELSLVENQISGITPLSGLTNLTRLVLESNQIGDIAPLSGLTNLTMLFLGGNQISDITPLGGLTNLTMLELSGNQISDITPLSGLTNLTHLGLFDNQITDWSPVSHLNRVSGRPN